METPTSVKGYVRDNAGNPIADAIVMVAESEHDVPDIAAVTNEDGSFFLSNIYVPGRYVLQIRNNDQSRKKEVMIQSKDSPIVIKW